MTQDTQAGAGAQPAPEQQSEALSLAQALDDNADLDAAEGGNPKVCQLERDAAAELRRLHVRTIALESQAAAKCLPKDAEPAPVTNMATDHACKWAWDQVRKDVGTEGWTTSDSCNFYGFFLWGWNYRGQNETQRPAAPPAPAAVAVPAESQRLAQFLLNMQTRLGSCREACGDEYSMKAWDDYSRAAALLAASPAQAWPSECDSPELCQVYRGCAGQYGTKNTCPSFAALNPCNSAAPAQAVAVPAEVELPDVEDMAHSAVQEALSFGVNHDIFHRWMRTVMDKTVQALAVAPAQAPEQWIDDPHDIEQGRMLNPEWVRAEEHATQLAGQGQNYSIDADPQGIRARVADAITGALGLGAQGSGNSPPDHWLKPFWTQARFGQIQYNALRDAAEAMLNAPGALTQAVRDVLAERARQVERKGYDPEYDDSHVLGEIGALAALYLMPEGARSWDASSTGYGDTLSEALLPSGWSLPAMGGDRRADAVKGVACGLAEIERLDRAAARAAQGGAKP